MVRNFKRLINNIFFLNLIFPKLENKKFAVYANDLDLAYKVIEKLKLEKYKVTGITPENMLYWGAYIPEKDIMVSHLCLEMHYPEYEENLIYGTEYLKQQ